MYAATSGIGASVTVEVTLTSSPERRARNCGSTACAMAIMPKVLVSNTSRTVAMGVASKAPKRPTPALFTSTSIGPAFSMAAAMLSGCVTSSGSTRRFGASGKRSSRGVRMVATTRQPWAWKWRAVARP